MKIERLYYGMFTGTGKIGLMLTPKVRSLVQPQNIEYIKALQPEQSKRYLWLPSEQVVAYPVVTEVKDEREGMGNRPWVQNQTFIMTVHDYISATQQQSFLSLVEPHILEPLEDYPESWNALTV